MPDSLESFSKTDPFAAAIALQEEHARAYSEMAERIRSDSPEAASFLLIASLGAGISMGFAEALSDDGVLSGRGRPWMRGGVCGLMTTLGGIGHTLPFLL
jgi:hypothetical protein